MTAIDDFEKQIAKLAKSIADKASADSTPLLERIDALKAMNGYYALLLKHRGIDEPDDEDTLAGMVNGINNASGDKHARVPGRS